MSLINWTYFARINSSQPQSPLTLPSALRVGRLVYLEEPATTMGSPQIGLRPLGMGSAPYTDLCVKIPPYVCFVQKRQLMRQPNQEHCVFVLCSSSEFTGRKYFIVCWISFDHYFFIKTNLKQTLTLILSYPNHNPKSINKLRYLVRGQNNGQNWFQISLDKFNKNNFNTNHNPINPNPKSLNKACMLFDKSRSILDSLNSPQNMIFTQ